MTGIDVMNPSIDKLHPFAWVGWHDGQPFITYRREVADAWNGKSLEPVYSRATIDSINEAHSVTEYRAFNRGENWTVERQYTCINGLSAWFTVAWISAASEEELGYTGGEFPSAELRAEAIASALNSSAPQPLSTSSGEEVSASIAASIAEMSPVIEDALQAEAAKIVRWLRDREINPPNMEWRNKIADLIERISANGEPHAAKEWTK